MCGVPYAFTLIPVILVINKPGGTPTSTATQQVLLLRSGPSIESSPASTVSPWRCGGGGATGGYAATSFLASARTIKETFLLALSTSRRRGFPSRPRCTTTSPISSACESFPDSETSIVRTSDSSSYRILYIEPLPPHRVEGHHQYIVINEPLTS